MIEQFADVGIVFYEETFDGCGAIKITPPNIFTILETISLSLLKESSHCLYAPQIVENL